MLYCLVTSLRLIFVFAGLFLLVRELTFTCLLKNEDDTLIFVTAKEDDEKLFDKIYGAHIRANIFCFSHTRPVYVIDCGLCESTKERLNGYFTTFAEIEFIDKDCISQFILHDNT